MEFVQLKICDHIAYITLNRSKVYNAINSEMVKQFSSCIEKIANNSTVRVVITRGEGGNLSAGSDLKQIANLSSNEAGLIEKQHADVFRSLDKIRPITIAVLEGYTLGGGLGLSLYHDFRIATQNAVIGLPEVELGWTPPWALGRLVDIVGFSKARWLTLSSSKISGVEAEKIGLVDIVFSDKEIDENIDNIANRFAGLSMEVIVATKQFFHQMSEGNNSKEWDDLAQKKFENCFSDESHIHNILKKYRS